MSTRAAQKLSTVRGILHLAVSRFNDAELFFGRGSDNTHNEAVYPILHTLNLPLDTLEPYLDAKLLQSEKEEVLGLIERRVTERVPVACLTHQVWQSDLDFCVDERVAVPRSSIYELLDSPLLPWIEHSKLVHRALGLCTGSGCLAIQMAHHYPAAGINAVDLSLDALEVAAVNIEEYRLEERIRLIHADLFEGLDDTYDLIVFNLSYVDAGSVGTLPDEYRHESELALDSGTDGSDATRRIILHAAKHLNPHGVLLMEIGHSRDILGAAYPELPFTWLETSGGDGFILLLTYEQLLGEK